MRGTLGSYVTALLAGTLAAQDSRRDPGTRELERALDELVTIRNHGEALQRVDELVARGEDLIAPIAARLSALRGVTGAEEAWDGAATVTPGIEWRAAPFGWFLPPLLAAADDEEGREESKEWARFSQPESLLQDPQALAAQRLQEVLSRLGPPAAPALARSIAPDYESWSILVHLKKLGASAREPLERALAALPENRELERAQLWIAFAATGERASEGLCKSALAALRGANARAALAAEVVLGRGGDASLLPQLEDLLAGNDLPARKRALRVLFLLEKQASAAVPGLETSIAKGDAECRALTLMVLAGAAATQEQKEHVVAACLEQRAGRDAAVREAAFRALARLAHPSEAAERAALDALQDRSPYVRAAALAALRSVGSPCSELLAPIRATLADRSTFVAAEALRTLGWLGAPALATLLERTHGAPRGMRSDLAKLLGRIGPPAFADLLVLAKSDDADDRETAARAFRSSAKSSPEAVDALLALGDDPARNVRAAALVGLGRASASAAIVPVLVKRLGDDDEEVSYAAALGLERLGPAAKVAAEALGEALGKGKPVQDHVILSALESLGADAAPALAALKRYLASGATENPSEYRLARRSKALVERLGKAR